MISLGINYSQFHDSSASIARDGEVLFAIAEERLSRVKQDARFPVRAIGACLEFAKANPEDLDFVCVGWPQSGAAFRHDVKNYLLGRQPVDRSILMNAVRGAASMWYQGGGENVFRQHFPSAKPQFRFIPHHLAHAISTYAYSGFDDAAILVLDGRGAWEATSLWSGRNGRIEHLTTIPWPNSLGLFYAKMTEHLGFEPYADEWKVMGLAPYGEPGLDVGEFLTIEGASYRVPAKVLMGKEGRAVLEARFGPRRVPESEITQAHKNLAFAVQDACERAMLALAASVVEKAGSRNICLAGGVALNSKANGKILSTGTVDRIFVQPAAGDDGVCLGAVLAPYLETTGRLPTRKMRHAYLGPSATDEEIGRALETYKLRAERTDDPAKVAAEMLADGKILGWFQGRMEFGPRALGGRSILADPRDPEMNAKVNNAVKFREWWRPFAPSMLAETAGEYIESATDSPFMILTAQVRPEKRAVIPSVTHVDGSARPQTVEKDVNPVYWRLIHEFGKLTGVNVVMNTSFNLRGEPIVCTPTDAVRTFFSSGMDALVIGNYVVRK
jgi:carbamoyltransferase